jgi:hypothetical protein
MVLVLAACDRTTTEVKVSVPLAVTQQSNGKQRSVWVDRLNEMTWTMASPTGWTPRQFEFAAARAIDFGETISNRSPFYRVFQIQREGEHVTSVRLSWSRTPPDDVVVVEILSVGGHPPPSTRASHITERMPPLQPGPPDGRLAFRPGPGRREIPDPGSPVDRTKSISGRCSNRSRDHRELALASGLDLGTSTYSLNYRNGS